jgi:hypothetical protein
MINQDFLDKYLKTNAEKEAKDFNKAVEIYVEAGFDRAHAEDMVRRGIASIREKLAKGEIKMPEIVDVNQEDEEIL